jgi:HTH-type transcriptional regulator/antitoxin HigA
MNKIKVIKTKGDYEDALKLVEALMSHDPNPDTEEGEKLSLLSTLVQDYEARVFPESLPDPIDAIVFRMEQENLKPRDLIPYIGSRSKVSEILSRKRPLTLSMMRSLETGLGIPARVLLRESAEFENAQGIAWDRFPLKEMERRGCFGKTLPKNPDIKSIMETLFQPVGMPSQVWGMLHKSNYRSSRPMNKYALIAWSGIVVKKTSTIKYPTAFKNGVIDSVLIQKLVQLSIEENGPILAREFLKKCGIALIIEPHFSQTYLDGATIMIDKDHPIIGLTLRYDRLDNFWFNLMHELAHIALHHDQSVNFYYDDLDSPNINDKQERDADIFAREALIPEGKWENSPARLIPSPIAAQSLAKELGIHIAIIAGRMRHEGQRYIYLNSIINGAKVRKYFPEEKWSK